MNQLQTWTKQLKQLGQWGTNTSKCHADNTQREAQLLLAD